jgi:predicted methyltransferase
MNQAKTQFPQDERAFRRLYRKRVTLFVFASIVACLVLAALYDVVQTMARLDRVEHERDTFQRPDVVLEELNVKDGGVVVDLGCGVGYFTLKASDQVGNTGKVLAVDILRLPLVRASHQSSAQWPTQCRDHSRDR